MWGIGNVGLKKEYVDKTRASGPDSSAIYKVSGCMQFIYPGMENVVAWTPGASRCRNFTELP